MTNTRKIRKTVLWGWLKILMRGVAPSNLAAIGRYVLTPDIIETLRGLSAGSGGEIQLANVINIHAK